MLQDVDVSPTPDFRGWSILLLSQVVHIADRATTDMCTECVGRNGMDGEDGNAGVCIKVDGRVRTKSIRYYFD